MRFFTPYKRRRRNQIEIDSKKKRQSGSADEYAEQEPVVITKEEPWGTLTDGIDGSSDFLDTTQIAEGNIPLERLKSLCVQMAKAIAEFRRCINEAQEIHVKQVERVQRERDAALIAARVHDIEDPNAMNIAAGVDLNGAKKVRLFIVNINVEIFMIHPKNYRINNFLRILPRYLPLYQLSVLCRFNSILKLALKFLCLPLNYDKVM